MTGYFLDKANSFALTLGRLVSFGSDYNRPYAEAWVSDFYHTNNFAPGPSTRTPFTSKAFVYPLITEDVRKVFGLPGAGAVSRTLEGPPGNVSKDFDGFADLRRFGNVFAAVLNLHTHRHSADWDRDTDIVHATYRGNYESVGSNAPAWGPVVYDSSMEGFPPNARLPRMTYSQANNLATNRYLSMLRLSKHDPSVFFIQERPDTGFNDMGRLFDLDHFIRTLQNKTIEYGSWDSHGARNHFIFSDFWSFPTLVADLGESHVTLRKWFGYDVSNEASSLVHMGNPQDFGRPTPWSKGIYRLKFRFDTTLYWNFQKRLVWWNNDFEWLDYAFEVAHNDDVECETLSYFTNVPVSDAEWDPYVTRSDKLLSNFRFNSEPICVIETPSTSQNAKKRPIDLFRDPEGSGFPSDDDSRLVRIFQGFCNSQVPEVLDFAALATTDAISQYRSDFNALEFTRELPETIKLVFSDDNFLSKLWSLFTAARQGRPLLSVDRLAELILTYSYGIGPVPSDLKSIKDIINHGVVLMGEIPSNLYGKFVYRDIDKFPLFNSDVKLTVRSKLRIMSNPALPILWAMTVDQVGFLPTLERLWALRRFSFVIDWFLNLDDRLRFWDSQAMLSMLDIGFFEHSFLFETPVPSNFARKFSVRVDGAQLRAFYRYRSLFHPTFRGVTKYDPYPSSGLDLLTAGPLLWTTLKSS